ncbi:MAG TPA: M1 family metallopeptidase [Chiayiivirga sp.]|nr:M1 family metallopeptidase [Chiayiivirga sp.]
MSRISCCLLLIAALLSTLVAAQDTTHVVAATAATPVAEIPLARGDAGAVHVLSAPDAWGGPRRADQATLSDQVVSYTIEATLDPEKHTIVGKLRMTWRNRSTQPVGSIYMHLYLNAFSGTDSTFFTEARESDFNFRSDVPTKEGEWGFIRLDKVQQAGVEVPWTFVQPDGGPKSDRTVVRLDLPEPVAAGATLTLDIDFFDQLPRVVARTGWFGSFHLVGQWYPKIGVLELPGERGAVAPRWNVHEFHVHSEFYADFGRFDVTLNVPTEVKVGATGVLTGTPTVAEGRTRYRYVQEDVHDFAWTADANYAEPLTDTWRFENGPEVQLRVLFPPEYEKSAAPALQATKDSLDYFSRTLGAYPYRSVTVVIPPYNANEAGGMEYPTFFTASGYSDPAKGSVARFGLDFVTVHEFGHGYFYGILASNEFEEPWMDEGLNEFWDQRMLAERHPDGVRITPRWMKWLGIDPSIGPFDGEALAAGLNDPVDALGHSAWDRYTSGSYSTIYSRTATMLRELEARVGTEKLERAFKHYYELWKFRHPSSADLREALAVGTGERAVVEDLFARHVYDSRKTGAWVVSFDSRADKPALGFGTNESGQWVETTEEARDEAVDAARKAWDDANPDAKDGVGGPYPYTTTVLLRRADTTAEAVRVQFADDSTQDFKWDDDRLWKRLVLHTKARATQVTIDPDGVRHLDFDKLDNARTVEPDSQASRRWGTEARSFWNGLLALLLQL